MNLKNEEHCLDIINQFFPTTHPSFSLGRGDDCAVFHSQAHIAVTTDIFSEDSHFRRQYFTPYDIGYKALAVNISDLCSAGAIPLSCSIGLTLTGKEDETWLKEFCRGLKDMSDFSGIFLSGGDLTRSSLLQVCITAFGELPECMPRGFCRGIAREGDMVFLIGEVGSARAGLLMLESCMKKNLPVSTELLQNKAVKQHLHPLPKIKESSILRQIAEKYPDSQIGLMDVSDGLIKDLPRLLDRSHTGLAADIILPDELFSEEVCAVAEKKGESVGEFAYIGGEDYALLGTCPSDFVPVIKKYIPNSFFIGTVRKGEFTLNSNPVSKSGFDHFISD